ncbi:MAG: helix-turn-helix domain-containing protein [bacterium]
MQNAASLQQKPTQFKISKITLQSLSKFSISPTAKLVLLYLVDCYNPAKSYIFPKQETMTDKLGISLSSVKRAIKELAKANIIIIELKFSNRYNLTPTFFDLLNMTPDAVQIEPLKCQNETNHVVTEKELNKKTEKTFIFKNLLELGKTNTIAYYEQILNLSDQDKEHLCKIKLGRMSLTDFQKVNIEKFIMLSDSEIVAINNKEPYHRQENIDIYYNSRMKKIKEFQEQPEKQEENNSQNERASVLAALKCSYQVNSSNKIKLIDLLNRSKVKMELFSITEAELCC